MNEYTFRKRFPLAWKQRKINRELAKAIRATGITANETAKAFKEFGEALKRIQISKDSSGRLPTMPTKEK